MKPRATMLNVCLSLCVVILLSLSALAAWAAGQSYYVPNEYIIHAQSGTSLADVEAIVNKLGASIVKKLPLSDTYHIRVGQSSLVSVAGTSSSAPKWVIDYIQPNYIYTISGEPNDAKWQDLWGMKMINMPVAWDVETGSSNIIVAVIDTGVANHPDLAGRLTAGWDFTEDESDASDDVVGHGTHVSGTIAANGDNFIGVVGVCSNYVQIMPLKVFSDSGLASTADIIDALAYARTNSAKVVNMSIQPLVAGTPADELEHEKIQELYAAGIILVASAGNHSSELPSYPAAFEEVISVSALDRNEQPAYYTDYGSTIDIAAPGGDVSSGTAGGIWSTTVTFAGTEATYGYDSWQGTSMACPHVSGAAALLLSAGILATDVRSRLLNNARMPATGTYNKLKYGAGVLDVAAALSNASIRILEPQRGGSVGINPTIKLSYLGIDTASIKVYVDYQDADDDGIPDDLSDTSSVVLNSTNIAAFLNTTNKTVSGSYSTITSGKALSQGDHKIYIRGNATVGGGTYSDWAVFKVSAAGFSQGIHFISLPYNFASSSGTDLSITALPENLFLRGDGTSVNFTVSGTTKATLTRWVPKTATDTMAGYFYYPYNALAWSNPFDYDSTSSWYTGGGFLGNLSGAYAFPAGAGFWLKLEEDAYLNSTFSAAITPIDKALNISLFKGWNMFGNPYDKQVSWGNVLFTYRGVKKTLADAQAAGWINSNVYYFTQGSSNYQKLSSRGFLDVYKGYWIYAYVGGVASGNSLVMTILP